MAIYTGIADANGDFSVPFSSAYAAGQKITITAEKELAQKTIEIYAPSAVTGGGIITWTGTTVDFPRNIGDVTIENAVNAAIASYAFSCYSSTFSSFGYHATGLVIKNAKTIGAYAFYNWINCKSLSLPAGLTSIDLGAFQYLYALNTPLIIPEGVVSIGNSAFSSANQCPGLTIPSTVTSIGDQAFLGFSLCLEINVLATVPPTIDANTFASLNSTCVIKVPAASLSAYQAAPNWSAHASKMIGV